MSIQTRPARTAAAAIAAGALVFSLSACSLIDQILPPQAQRDAETQEVSEAGNEDAFSLIVGDCFNQESDSAEETEVSSVPVVPCAEPHDFEIYHAFDLSDETYPGLDAIYAQADEGCEAAFEPFVGVPYLDSTLYYAYLYPSEGSWKQGDREILCYLYGDEQYSETLADSGL